MESTDSLNNIIDAAQAVQLLVAHVSAQERSRQKAKDTKGSYEPADEEKAERDRLLRQVLAALGCTRAELLTRLHIDRATWDRWRNMTTLPQRIHLETLTRFAGGKFKDNDAEPSSRPRPLDMLSVDQDERTWGRLRLIYSFFPWENIILCFKDPFEDVGTVTEMALLALRDKGVDIIYMLSDPGKWAPVYIESLKKVLGETDAARVLSKICVVKVDNEKMPATGFCLFNYESGDPDLRAGYRWVPKQDRDEKDRPKEDETNVYEPLSANSKQFSEVRRNFGEDLALALKIIENNERQLPDFWEPNLDDETIMNLLHIPIVTSGSKTITFIPHKNKEASHNE